MPRVSEVEIKIRVPRWVVPALERAAAAKGLKKSSFIRMILLEELKRLEELEKLGEGG